MILDRVIGPEKSKNQRGDQALFWGEKFENANYTSFERARRAESNDTKINEIRLDWTEIQTPEPPGCKIIGTGFYTNDSSFERARRAESNDIKINVNGHGLTKL